MSRGFQFSGKCFGVQPSPLNCGGLGRAKMRTERDPHLEHSIDSSRSFKDISLSALCPHSLFWHSKLYNGIPIYNMGFQDGNAHPSILVAPLVLSFRL